ncbi:ABC transporter ATP-binding protein [Pelagibius sp.]|uniref:ABC transporter ATP-binding protein n=1 Tax=Pelagibius sp. TaxID=1931238 RepID=UPI003BB0885B
MDGSDAQAEPLLRVDGLTVVFGGGRQGGGLTAVDGASFTIGRSETMALVGESGSGKSTIARAILGLIRPTSGDIVFKGHRLTRLRGRALRALRPQLQMVFQDPWAALNARMSVARLIEEPLLFASKQSARVRRERVRELVNVVELDESLLERHPPQLSGGQLQRVCIARAIASRPDLLVLDEPTSSLDLSVRASIIDLLRRLQADTGMAMLFISHDIGTVRTISSRSLVLHHGRVMEVGPTGEVLAAPSHPYTKKLMEAFLPVDPDRPRRDVLAAAHNRLG